MMDFVEFCEYVLGHPLSDWQKTYLTEMYNKIKKVKEENKAIIIKDTRGSSKNMIHLVALLLINEYVRYLKGEKDG